jgi:hypothetical protein
MKSLQSTDEVGKSVITVYYGEDPETHELTLVKENTHTGEVYALSPEEEEEFWRQNLEEKESERPPADYTPTFRYEWTGQSVKIVPIDECLPDGTEDIFIADSPEPKPVLNFDHRRDVYYDSARKSYLMKDSSGAWFPVTEAIVKRRIKLNYKSSLDTNWSADPYLDEIFTKQSVNFAGSVAGYKIGSHNIGGQRVLVTDEAKLLNPSRGDWFNLKYFLSGLFLKNEQEAAAQHVRRDGSAPTQLDYFYGWLHIACRSLYYGEKRPGQAPAFCGPRACGKSYLQAHVITPLLGSRIAKPYQEMIGGTHFNKDVNAAEHLIIDDENPHTNITARRNFGTAIKRFTVNENVRMEAKFQDAFMLDPWRRLTISLNDNADDLLVLPPMDDSLSDKIMLFKVGQLRDKVSGTADFAGREAFSAKIQRELPAFLFYLLHEYRIPQEIKSDRFGVTHFHHPDILRELSEASPESYFLELIDSCGLSLFGTKGEKEWTGKAAALSAALKDPKSSPVHAEATKLLSTHHKAGSYLSKLSKQQPNRVKSKHDSHAKANIYTILPPSKK